MCHTFTAVEPFVIGVEGKSAENISENVATPDLNVSVTGGPVRPSVLLNASLCNLVESINEGNCEGPGWLLSRRSVVRIAPASDAGKDNIPFVRVIASLPPVLTETD
jgi:hypothetical protein